MDIDAPQSGTPQDLVALLDWAAGRWAERPVLIFDEFGETISFGQLAERTREMSAVLQSIGVNQGDRVAVMLRNRPEFPITWLALARLGAVMVPLNVYYREADASYVLNDAGAVAMVTEAQFTDLAVLLRDTVASVRTIVSVDTGVRSEEVLSLANLVERTRGAGFLARAVQPETTVNIQYTSGTTGYPKGCVLSQFYWVRLGRVVAEGPPELTAEDVFLTAQPFYYMDPQWNLAGALAVGASLVVLDRFHPSTFWEKIRQYDVSFFYCLGMMPPALYNMPAGPQDRQHRVKGIACSAIPVRLHAALEERWGAPWYEAFGMTETGGDVRITATDHDDTVGSGCIGIPYHDREVRVLDGDGRPVARGKVGEMVLRGPGMMDGYFNNPDATNLAFRGGWFHTGDLVRRDENGRVFYLGRVKDTIRRSGENISSAEVEGVVMEHPAVAAAACVPVPDELRGEEVKVYVVLSEQSVSPDPPAIAAFCSERLAYFKVPRYWAFVVDLPRTPSERVAKGELVNGVDDLRLDAFDVVDGLWR
jgi:crotonobetaine/carnitine-CoA ligase